MARAPGTQDKSLSDEATSVLSALQIRFGERLRQARLAAGMTQAEMAERSGIHEQYVGRVEQGRKNLRLDTMVRLAMVVGHSVSDMLRDLDAPQSGKSE